MTMNLQNQAFNKIEADISICFMTETLFENHHDKTLLERSGFEAKQDQVTILHEKAIIFCGVEAFDNTSLRSVAALAIKALHATNYTSAKVAQYGLENIQAVYEGLILGGYEYVFYKSEPKAPKLQEILFSNDNFEGNEQNFIQLQNASNTALAICNATNFTRDLVNTAPQEMYPEALADVALDLAETSEDLSCTVIEYDELLEQGMNAIAAVGRASIHKPNLIHLAYTPKNATHTISLVGKGLTYDSGGLSLKPAASMVTMKMDKAGGCAVLGIMKAISELKLPITVNAFVGAAENMVDGSAYKPDDVLVAKNGKTIEVRNTDAEGRLVLADVLCYAQEQVKSDFIFDYATLTGACMVALGPYTTGMMGHSSKLKHQFFAAADRSGELVGTLPFNPHLKKLLKSGIADISNIGSKPYGGAITAALFLDNFIEEDMKEKWLHFDIAGPAYTESAWDCNPFGSTGAGVRMSVNFMQRLLEK
jgi:leucyl aminopeptidase